MEKSLFVVPALPMTQMRKCATGVRMAAGVAETKTASIKLATVQPGMQPSFNMAQKESD